MQQVHIALEGKSEVDPFVIVSWINAGLALLSNGLAVAGQALSLILPFI
ncbi:hypothetical protein NDR87_14270 [Nocardia sp. CDC159]|uniref:Uncharacterized protein n=1 Tax=Nocardia pulmonis TaxID=2951408 RepID=A0A9X2E689_9NOCA|nr:MULTISPECIES: hypothetical protein [Nocardia]MCM6774410.1 hypothetical protein [Nocardia pulmonis]MCM6787524.1 hypothetical protein [Nocardia sp. CDC159]